MADEKEVQAEESEVPKKSGNKTLIIIIAVVVVVLGAGGFVGFTMLTGDKTNGEQVKKEAESKTSIIALDPFVLNLSDRGRYLKVTIQFEIADETQEELVKTRTAQLRDTIITLVSSKSLNSISSPEGKFQLKDEILFRANQIMGEDKDMFRNLFFTEFVMQ